MSFLSYRTRIYNATVSHTNPSLHHHQQLWNLPFSPAVTTLSLSSPHKRNGPLLIQTLERLVRDCFIFFKRRAVIFHEAGCFSPAIAVCVHCMVQRETARGANTSAVIGYRPRTLAWPSINRYEPSRSGVNIKRKGAGETVGVRRDSHKNTKH